VVKLKKALYGLKDAPLAWYMTLSRALFKLGFERSLYDDCLFFRHTEEGLHIILVHVDDVFSCGPRFSMTELRNGLRSTFKEVTMQVNPHNFTYLGFAVERDRAERTFTLRQTKYIEDALGKFQFAGEKVSVTPSNGQLFEIESKSPRLEDDRAERFRSVTMSLLYVTKSRPDIKCTVAFLSTRLRSPALQDWMKLRRLMSYVHATKHLGLVVRASDLSLRGSADASHGCHVDGKGHSGGVIWFGQSNAPIMTICKKQTMVARSSMAAELLALDTLAVEGLWMRQVLMELDLDGGHLPFAVEQDNISSSHVLKAPSIARYSKNVYIKHQWLRERLGNGELEIVDTRTSKMLADGLTKPLPTAQFTQFRSRILNLQD
jgi:hypothetical protein